MGASSNGMGGAASPTQATQGTGMQPGGFDLSKLFMGNAPTNPAGGGQQLPQIMPPPRQPMPTMPVRTPMPQPAAAPELSAFEKYRQAMISSQQMSGLEKHLARRSGGGGR